MKAPFKSTLPVDDPHALLAALQGDVDPAQLLCIEQGRLHPDASPRSVHAHALSWFLCGASNDVESQYLRDCCLRLIDLKAPMTDAYGDGAVAQFCGYRWPTAPAQIQQVADLADAYVRSGLFELDSPMPGVPLDRRARRELDGCNQDGLVPLASAIFESNPPLARYLCERGVSLELGVVFAGEPAMNAVDLALDEREGEIHSILVAAAMTRRLTSEPAAAAVASAGDATTNAAPARRSRRVAL